MRKDEKSRFPVTLAILEYAQFLDRPNLSFEMEEMWVKLYIQIVRGFSGANCKNGSSLADIRLR